MQGTETTVHTLATEAASWFETATRTDGENYTRCKPGVPGWVTDLVYDAHGDMLPDDWRYSAVRDALDAIDEAGEDADLDDLSFEFAVGAVDVYTGARLAWLASHLSRPGYVDEGIEEMGGGRMSDGEYGRGGGEPLGVIDMIGHGQYREAHEVFSSVRTFLETRADELNDAAGEEDDA